MDKFLEQFLKIPLPTRIAGLGGICALLTAMNYFVFFGIADVEQKIIGNQAQFARLQKDLFEKQIIANNLNQYRREKELLEQKLAEALTELPNTKEIDELIRQLNDVGKKASLEISSIEPGPEQPEAFFAKIPIKMTVLGNFHEIALFFESVSRLRRIVNISNISFKDPQRKNEKVLLKAEYLATTFRFVAASAGSAPKPGGTNK